MTVSPRTLAFPAAGGTANVTVTTSGTCHWTPRSATAWLQTAPASGGASVVALPNADPSPRAATVDLGGVAVAVTQDAAPLPNMIVNGSFDHDVANWSTIYSTGSGALQWSAGAAQLSLFSAKAIYQMQQCVNVTPGNYSYGLKTFVPAGQDAAGRVQIGVFQVTVPNCATTVTYAPQIDIIDPPKNVWNTFTKTVTILDGIQSVYFVIGVGGSVSNPPFTANFDDVFFRPQE